MFWNPATMTQFKGMVGESGISGIFTHASQNPQPGSAFFNVYPGEKNSGETGLVPNSYTSFQLNQSIWIGLGINAPFGLSVNFQDPWAGRSYGLDTTLKSYNATPSIAWRINDWISVGVGVQLQYADIHQTTGLGPFPGTIILDGKGWAFGATAGVTFTPWPSTTIGLGWRSGLNQDINGTLSFPAVIPGTNGSVTLTANLPDIVSLGIRHRIDERWTVMGTAEWSNWSRIGTVSVNQLSGAPATIGVTPVTIPFQYDDGWFFSGGAEYRWNERLALRGGIGYEKSPISDRVRTPRLPDNDRFWASIGASWVLTRGIHFDLAYTHLWVKDPNINITATSGSPYFTPSAPVPYIGTVDAHSNIISGALVVQLDALVAPPPKPLITK